VSESTEKFSMTFTARVMPSPLGVLTTRRLQKFAYQLCHVILHVKTRQPLNKFFMAFGSGGITVCWDVMPCSLADLY